MHLSLVSRTISISVIVSSSTVASLHDLGRRLPPSSPECKSQISTATLVLKHELPMDSSQHMLHGSSSCGKFTWTPPIMQHKALGLPLSGVLGWVFMKVMKKGFVSCCIWKHMSSRLANTVITARKRRTHKIKMYSDISCLTRQRTKSYISMHL